MRIDLVCITKLLLTRPFIKRFIRTLDEAIEHEASLLVIKGGAVVVGLIFLFKPW
jgi:hypothetical protein